jgi:hypothetical protein
MSVQVATWPDTVYSFRWTLTQERAARISGYVIFLLEHSDGVFIPKLDIYLQGYTV